MQVRSLPTAPIMWNIEKVIKKGDYLYGVCREHPKADKHGYVLLHRLIAENKIGRLLSEDEEVHHKDHDGHNNSEDNLEVMTTAEHRRLHRLEHPRRMVTLNCDTCNTEFTRPANKAFNFPKKNHFCSKGCKYAFYRKH